MPENLTISYEQPKPEELTEDDASDVAELSKDLTPNNAIQTTRDSLATAAGQHHVLVARLVPEDSEKRRRIIGMGRLILSYSPATGRDAIIADVVVRKSGKWRGKNVGKRISQLLVRAAREAGAHQVWLRSGEHRTAAHRLYESIGFKRKDSRIYVLNL